MTNPAWTPSSNESDPAGSREATCSPSDEAEAERVRQGRVVLRSRAERITFAAGLALPVVVLVVLWLAHLL